LAAPNTGDSFGDNSDGKTLTLEYRFQGEGQILKPTPTRKDVNIMGLPKQVEEAGKLADELLNKQLNPEPTAKEAEPELKEPEPEPKEPEVKPESEMDKLQQKFNVLQGKYNAEVNDTRQTNQYLADKVRKLELANQELESAKVQPGVGPVSQKLDLSKFLTEEQMARLEDEMDPEVQNVLADLVRNVSATTAAYQAETIKKDLDVLKEGQTKNSWESFLGRVYKAVPDIEAVNVNPKFIEFMNSKVPGTGATRQAIMDNAAKRLDFQAVIEIYQDFADLQPARVDPAKRKDLRSQVDPVTKVVSQDRQQLMPASDKIFTIAQVNDHYKQMALAEASNYTRGKYANKPELAKQVDAELLQANLEGRITR